jgi:phospholipase C
MERNGVVEEPLHAWFSREVLSHDVLLRRVIARLWRNLDDRADFQQEVYARVFEAARKARPLLRRREFLQLLILCAVGAGAPSGARSNSKLPVGRLSDIDHVFIMMQENRSFDHYFGALAGVRGFSDPAAIIQPNGLPIFFQPDATSPTKYRLPFRLNTQETSAQRRASLDHSWKGQHSHWNEGANNGWVAANTASQGPLGPWTMGYYNRQDLPFYYALADAFTICDGYHCSVLASTMPNRFMALTGTIDPRGEYGGPQFTNNVPPSSHKSPIGELSSAFSWETYPERLDRAGVSWRNYCFIPDLLGNNTLSNFVQFQNAPRTSSLYAHGIQPATIDEFIGDIRRGNVPQVSWITAPPSMWEHPALGTPLAGQHFVHRILTALWSNSKLWAKSLFILHYDENDGLFDHVMPPTPEPGTPGEFLFGEPIGLGFRVPCLLISPWSRGGYVCSDTFDHTSTLMLLERRFGVEVGNLSAWRRQTCSDLTAALGLRDPPRLDVPALPDTEVAPANLAFSISTLPAPRLPEVSEVPKQEVGSRRRRGKVLSF